MNSMVFLDFDGVLFDTVKEAYAIAMLTHSQAKSIKEIDFNSHHYYRLDLFDISLDQLRITCF